MLATLMDMDRRAQSIGQDFTTAPGRTLGEVPPLNSGKLEQPEVVARRLADRPAEDCRVEADEHSGAAPIGELARQLLIGGAGRSSGTFEELRLRLSSGTGPPLTV